MARGWESKSVEEQQSLDPVPDQNGHSAAQKDNNLDRAKRARMMQDLGLQRERILSERTSSPVRRAALEAALAEIESRIAELN